MTELGRAWASLGETDNAGDGWLARRVHASSPVPLFAGRLAPSGSPALLVEAEAAAIPPIGEWPSGRGFEVVPHRRSSGSRGTVWIVLGLKSEQFGETFAVLAEDVASHVAAAADARAGVRALLGRLRTWQEFLRRHDLEAMSEQEQTGLFAELDFLETFVLPRLAAAEALTAWKSPEEGLHDFRLPDGAVEVKGTTRVPPDRFSVPCLAQLDETAVGRLVLMHTSLAEGGEAALSLPDLVERIRGRLAAEQPAAAMRFTELLASRGYLDVHTASYAARRLRIVERQAFRVESGFPRLRPRDVLGGIIECSYEVALAECAPFRLSDLERAIFGGTA
jgi:hypothetical protein